MAKTRAGSSNSGYRTTAPVRLPRSAFDLSYTHKTTIQPGLLYPLYAQEVMPGDTISWSPNIFIRQSSSVFPVMDGLRCEYQAFFVPARILWDNWAKMHGERTNPGDHVDYTVPQVEYDTAVEEDSLANYLGVPIQATNPEFNALFPRAYGTIWNEWYRDENLQDSIVVPTGDGPDTHSMDHLALLPRGKPKDRFGGALPFAQKGDPVSMPLGTTAPVQSDGTTIQLSTSSGGTNNQWQSLPNTGSSFSNTWTAAQPLFFGSNTGLEVDLTSATAATVNEMRQAIALQQLFERDARGSNRYATQIYSHFGVTMPDVRYRPELLCVGSVSINPLEVPQTSSNVGVNYQGNPTAMVKGAGKGRGFTKSIDEWGYIIANFSIVADISYSQGIPAQMLRKTRIDHYTPDLALLGEEAIPSAEIYMDGTGDPDALTGDYAPWGFTPRYESYRHRVNQISGHFRSDASATEFGQLDRYHYGLDFDSRPSLDAAFIEADPTPIVRNTFTSTIVPPFYVDLKFNATGVRPMPKVATPGLLRF